MSAARGIFRHRGADGISGVPRIVLHLLVVAAFVSADAIGSFVLCRFISRKLLVCLLVLPGENMLYMLRRLLDFRYGRGDEALESVSLRRRASLGRRESALGEWYRQLVIDGFGVSVLCVQRPDSI